jgi:hypothetical protein
VALVLGIFSWRKVLVLGWPSDGEVELTGGGPVMGAWRSALAQCEEERCRA